MSLPKLSVIDKPNKELFENFKQFATSSDGWTSAYKKDFIEVFTRPVKDSKILQIKIVGFVKNLKAEDLYDTIHDGKYRKVWDLAMLEGEDVCRIGTNSDIGYYLFKCPKIFKNRDFLTQRFWIAQDNEFIIFNHSVSHSKFPPSKKAIRAISHITGYYIEKIDENTLKLITVTHNDPRGSIPKDMLNILTKKMGPKIFLNLIDQARKYADWKKKNEPDFKPWIKPEQMQFLPEYDPKDGSSELDLGPKDDCSISSERIDFEMED